MLDSMDLERERGITIKASAVALHYKRGDETFLLNLIDTPGHVDFSYEVSRSLTACDGALLVVDATQGIEAQTIANAHLAFQHDLRVLVVINKIDIASARPLEVMEEVEASLGVDVSDMFLASAKTGEGVQEILDAIIDRVPPPKGNPDAPLRALVFDSTYDAYRGVIVYCRVFDGQVKPGDRIRLMASGNTYEVQEVGVFVPEMRRTDGLETGAVGYLTAGIKTIKDIQIGDTITLEKEENVTPLPGYREPKPMVFCGFYPVNSQDYERLRDAMAKLQLNDASFRFEPETSEALGFGFRCGFLGMLHMEIVQERIEREFDVDLVKTAPNVTYQVALKNGDVMEIENPADMPDMSSVEEIREPIIRAQLVTPTEFIGGMMQLIEEKRGEFIKSDYVGQTRVILTCDLPMSEILYDFHDRLKSATRGHGTMDYELLEYRANDLVRLDILVAGKRVDALSCIVHRAQAAARGRALARKLRKQISRHMFEVVIQAAIGGKIIARETVPPLAKNVLAKCYGGDVTRKRKLLEKQKAGKKRMKMVGNVEIPQEAFMIVLSTDAD